MKTIIILIVALLSSSLFADETKVLSTIKTLGENLKKELQAAMKTSPIKALEVCNTKAMPITKAAAAEGIRVGRVSTKNRNPGNAPKEWMKATINKYHAGEIKAAYAVVDIDGGKKGILKPIKTMPLCLNCHGTEIKPEIQSKITELYPADKATGYKVGDIRGFFWAEY